MGYPRFGDGINVAFAVLERCDIGSILGCAIGVSTIGFSGGDYHQPVFGGEDCRDTRIGIWDITNGVSKNILGLFNV